MKITKKQISAAKAAAFSALINALTPDEFNDLFGTSLGATVYEFWEGERHEFHAFTKPSTQINSEFLKSNGFTDKAKIRRLFVISRTTKTIEF